MHGVFVEMRSCRHAQDEVSLCQVSAIHSIVQMCLTKLYSACKDCNSTHAKQLQGIQQMRDKFKTHKRPRPTNQEMDTSKHEKWIT